MLIMVYGADKSNELSVFDAVLIEMYLLKIHFKIRVFRTCILG